MEKYFHDMASLFKQLGLSSLETDINSFISSHQTTSPERIEKLPFWTDTQSDFLKQCLESDSDWTEIVDELDALLRMDYESGYSNNESIHRTISIILKSFILIGALFCFIREHYLLGFSSMLVYMLSSLPWLMARKHKIKIPAEFEFLSVFFIFLTLYLGNIQGFYEKFWWWDLFLHTSSGFMLGIVGFLLIFILNETQDIILNLKPGFMALFAFSFAISLGTIWEIFEFTMDSFFDISMQQSGLVDTMWDLIVDSMGALVISLMGAAYYKKMNHNSFLEKWLNKFISKNPKLFEPKS